jgi:signal transduction histidine kinase/CheY-like chemotaxis protein/ligand-binding sensor domain-containing protein
MKRCLGLIGSLGANCWLFGLVIISFIAPVSRVMAQSVRVLSTKDGLPQSFVSGLVQDDSSFIWIGTRNGLARYDGIQFRDFQHDPQDSTTLASNIIIWMKRDSQNQLWIEYESGEIDRMDPVTEKIQHFLKGNLPEGGGVQFVRRGWLVDKDGVFWGIVRGAGVNIYDSHAKKIERFNRSNSGFPSDTLWGLAEVKNQGIWMVSQRGISLFNKKTKHLEHWQLPFEQDFNNFPESDAVAIDLHERKNGELMWGDRQKLIFFNPATHIFRTVPLPSIAYLGVRWIRTGNDGLDYFETYGKVYRYGDQHGLNSIGNTITEFFGDVKSFLVDRSGLIWMGTNAKGIDLIDLQTPFFQSYKYKKDFATDMLQQEFGIDMPQMFNWTPKDQAFSPPSYHFRSVYDANRRLYLALNKTVCYYDKLKKQYVKLPPVPLVAETPVTGIVIKGIAVTSNGAPMVITYNGNVLSYDSTRKTWNQFIDPYQIRKIFGSKVLAQDILADDSSIWVTTAADGLLEINIRTKEIRQFKENQTPGSMPTDQLLALRADPLRPDIIWIGSYQGLISLNKKTLHCESFSLKEGLPDNTIYSILPDRVGNLWLSTNKGICRFDPGSHQVRVFNTRYGLPGDEFNRFHQLELPDGRLTFGGTDGWTSFDPLSIKNDDYEPALAFTDLRVNNKDASSSKNNGLLHMPLNAISQLILPYEQNTISVGFAGLEFGQPQDLKYRYRLEGYDNDWVLAGNAHQANYTKIPPGNYTLFVNASNTSGKWSAHIRNFKVKIGSPWWSTPMAYFCYCIILTGLTWTFIRLRVTRLLMKREMELKEKEALQLKELDDMKSRFFSNITHEFRTPLTLILGPAEQLKQAHALGPAQSRMADTIVQNAKQLLILINRLMDLSRLEAKALQLHEKRGNPADAVSPIVQSFEGDAGTKEIELLFDDQTGHIDCWFYADAVKHIVYNLVSNALKFTDTGGRVEILLSSDPEELHIEVMDTGTGIPESKLPNIFDRFYQAHGQAGMASQEWNQGTGIGLSLVKELVDQLHGRIGVTSRTAPVDGLSSGTVFKIDLPYRLAKQEDERSPAEEEVSGPKQTDETAPVLQVLLVEDNVELADFITGILSAQYGVTHVLNGSLGLDQALSMIPDVIISDIMMPVMDGYELCDRLKTDIRTDHIPVILLTAKVSQENLIEGLERGADDYLTKPFNPTELLLRIRNLLERQRKLRERIRQQLALPGDLSTVPETIPQDVFITRLYEVLDDHLDDAYFGVDQLVGLINMSRSNLHRKLKALTGMSTSEVVRNYRLKRASLLLKEGFNSSDTAYKTGFGSPAYFTKSFREVYGITPTEFVKQYKPGPDPRR